DKIDQSLAVAFGEADIERRPIEAAPDHGLHFGPRPAVAARRIGSLRRDVRYVECLGQSRTEIVRRLEIGMIAKEEVRLRRRRGAPLRGDARGFRFALGTAQRKILDGGRMAAKLRR